jgi:hypothetical protein
MQGAVWSAILAAGMLPIRTVAAPLMMASGNGGCGTGVGTGAAGCIGAWQCGPLCKTLSPNLAAGWLIIGSSVGIRSQSIQNEKMIMLLDSIVQQKGYPWLTPITPTDCLYERTFIP